MRTVDLNADLGESAERWESGEDRELLALVTSANVCAGAYAGDRELTRLTCQTAAEHGIAIGAQIGYPDREGFGRRAWNGSLSVLGESLVEQLTLLHEAAAQAGGHVAYVKPHGALYNRIVTDRQHAAIVVEAVAQVGPWRLLGLPGSVSLDLASQAGLATAHEGFADRGYTPTGTLVPRSEPGAVLTDPATVAAQAISLVGHVDSICVHSDSPGAIASLRAVRTACAADGIEIAAPW